jgi:predicted O-methyltransferase YrrM
MPRSFSHWTPRYIRDRVAVILNERRNPKEPWLTKDAVRFLDESLKPGDRGLEFGSGRSSVWFAKRIAHLISVEDNKEWFTRVTGLIAGEGLSDKIDYRFRAQKDDYVTEASAVPDDSIDFCLVDGSHRDDCAIRVIPKVRSGGLLVVDNINWYLPSDTIAPTSRKPAEGCATPTWTEFANQVAGWRRYWTSNGVTNTCIWFKP